MRQLEVILAPAGSTTVVTQVLSGDGGIGKTQLAAKLYHLACISHAYDLCLWLTAASEDTIITGYAQAMNRIKRDETSDDPRDTAHRFLTWLRETRSKWFVVLDDVKRLSDIEDWWPAGLSGRTIVTTRWRDAAFSENGRAMINLDVFNTTEARDYLVSRLSLPPTGADALDGYDKLAASLGCLPLALSQAAAVIINQGITCGAFQKQLADRTKTLRRIFGEEPDELQPPATPDQRQQQTLTATWSLATQVADNLQPRGFSRPLLNLIAVLDPNGVPETVFTTSAVQEYAENYVIGQTSDSEEGRAESLRLRTGAERQRNALRALHRLSLIVHEPNDSIRSVRMHALAQRTTREAAGKEELQQAYTTAADALIEVWPHIERHVELSAVLRQNAATLADLHYSSVITNSARIVALSNQRSLPSAGLQQAGMW
jgi:NB-ARC domain